MKIYEADTIIGPTDTYMTILALFFGSIIKMHLYVNRCLHKK